MFMNLVRERIVNLNTEVNVNCVLIVGIELNDLKNHIEKQFTEGMNWDNYGVYGWHIDHIIPLCTAKDENELLKLFHYTNLQPLWAEDNLKKNGRILI